MFIALVYKQTIIRYYIRGEYLKYLYLFITQYPNLQNLIFETTVQKYHERLQAEVEIKKEIFIY